MSLSDRIVNIIKQKVNKLVERHEDPPRGPGVKENLTGISEEMSDIGVGISRAEEKTEALKSKSMAIDEMIDSGILIDHTNNKDQIEMELERSETKEKVESELDLLKSSLA
ncbi:MAG: hypothetical protein L0H53_08820 [Candidatus Nitrosocosmicus sp.]|nr:hypothetical protein [Candidatus Nitrosocosmicus sp.]MDN5868824.1 hypothetical protein [Candidatus Nitrosocosmicus sp.]